MSTSSRLGKDPLARPSGASRNAGSQALRHILDLGGGCGPEADPAGVSWSGEAQLAASPPEPSSAGPRAPGASPEDSLHIYGQAVGKFSKAMDDLTRLAAESGVWAWGTGEGDSFLFMRLMAAYRATPDGAGDGVDLASFLHDVHDHWERHDIALRLDLARPVVGVDQAFRLARALQAVMDGFLMGCGGRCSAPRSRRAGCGGRALDPDCPAGLTLAARTTHGQAASGGQACRVVLRFCGPAQFFSGQDPVFSTRQARALTALARAGQVSLRFSRLGDKAELLVII